MCIAHLLTAGQVKKEVVASLRDSPHCNDATTLIIHWRKREKFCCDTEEGEWIISTLLLLPCSIFASHKFSLPFKEFSFGAAPHLFLTLTFSLALGLDLACIQSPAKKLFLGCVISHPRVSHAT